MSREGFIMRIEKSSFLERLVFLKPRQLSVNQFIDRLGFTFYRQTRRRWRSSNIVSRETVDKIQLTLKLDIFWYMWLDRGGAMPRTPKPDISAEVRWNPGSPVHEPADLIFCPAGANNGYQDRMSQVQISDFFGKDHLSALPFTPD